MKATLQFKITDAVEAEIKLTLPLAGWKRIREQLKHWDGNTCALREAIDDLVDRNENQK